MTAAEVAARLSISKKTLQRHVDDARIACVDVGTGQRAHLRFAPCQLHDFISSQTREVLPCPSTKAKPALSISTISKSTAIAFTELPRPETRGTRKPSSDG
ncbi:helix-turn-helix domain-containing protein [Sinorhizobium americanum]|uniref:helix-turn-helix domain-containing protein n=1 Tax=Sinorhizobium americanum TaxID=194963 RepID=UPI00104D3162